MIVEIKRWRKDGRCGANFTINGNMSECNPDGVPYGACCSPDGWCGNSRDHCDCKGCQDYRIKRKIFNILLPSNIKHNFFLIYSKRKFTTK